MMSLNYHYTLFLSGTVAPFKWIFYFISLTISGNFLLNVHRTDPFFNHYASIHGLMKNIRNYLGVLKKKFIPISGALVSHGENLMGKLYQTSC